MPGIPVKNQYATRVLVTIGYNCWLGNKATILLGIKIWSRNAANANSTFIKDIPGNSIIGDALAKALNLRQL